MRNSIRISIVVLFLPVLGATQFAAQTKRADGEALSVISGVVLDIRNGTPVTNATIFLHSAEGKSTVLMGARSGVDGSFTIRDVPAGRYLAKAEKPNFIARFCGQGDQVKPVPILVNASTTSSVECRLIPHGVIAGRITDANGNPLTSAMVQLVAAHLVDGRQTAEIVARAPTNDLGEYRMFGVAPGSYYVSAFYRDDMSVLGLRERVGKRSSSDESTTEDYAVTYYPGGLTLDSATALRVQPGQVVSNIDIHMEMAVSASIRGTVANLPAMTKEVQVMLQPVADNAGPHQMFALRGGETRFTFKSIPPGEYLISAVGNQGVRASKRLVISGSFNIEGVVLALQPSPFTVKGVIAMDSNGAIPENLSLVLSGADPQSRASIKPTHDGHFETTLAADNYRLEIKEASGPMYIKSVTVNQQTVSPLAVDIDGSGDTLQIVVSNRAGQIEGAVADSEGRPSQHGLVLATAQDGKAYYMPVGSDGTFMFKSLAPGNYRVMCFSDIEFPGDITPDVLKKVKAEGTQVSLNESERRILKIGATQANPT